MRTMADIVKTDVEIETNLAQPMEFMGEESLLKKQVSANSINLTLRDTDI
jgi:hypothetical protein